MIVLVQVEIDKVSAIGQKKDSHNSKQSHKDQELIKELKHIQLLSKAKVGIKSQTAMSVYATSTTKKQKIQCPDLVIMMQRFLWKIKVEVTLWVLNTLTQFKNIRSPHQAQDISTPNQITSNQEHQVTLWSL